MKFGMLQLFERPMGRSEEQLVREQIDMERMRDRVMPELR